MSDALRIAFIGQRSIPAAYGGVEVFAEEAGARLAERGHHVTAFCAEPGAKGTAEYRGMTLRYVAVSNGKHTRALSQTFMSSIRCLGDSFDVVHYMAMGPTIASPIVRFGSKAGVVATIAGRDDQRAKWNRPAQLVMRTSLETLRRTPHRVIPVSKELFDDFLPSVGDRLRHVPNGIAPPDYLVDSDEIVRSLGFEPDRYLLYTGRLVAEKRLDDLITAFRRTSLSHKLVIAGGINETNRHLARLREAAGDDPRIEFVGHLSARDIQALQRHASLIALVSELEGLPFALLEATSRGAPVLVSDLPCHLEVIGTPDAGATVVSVGDISAIQAGIEKMVADPSAVIAASKRAVAVLDMFAWEGVIDQVVEVYREAVHAARPVRQRR